MTRILDGFISSSYVISCLCASCVQAIDCVAGSVKGCKDPMRDNWENNLEEFKFEAHGEPSLATRLSIY